MTSTGVELDFFFYSEVNPVEMSQVRGYRNVTLSWRTGHVSKFGENPTYT